MSNSVADYNVELFKQDLKNYTNAIKVKDFRTGNILANRIMSNSHLFDKQYFGIVGFFLKQITSDAIALRNVTDQDSIATILNAITNFIENTIFPQISSEKYEIAEVWRGYSNFMIKTRDAYLFQEEKEIYKINSKITEKAFNKILGLLFKEKELLTYPTNNFLKGLINEMNRVGKTYGIETKNLYLQSLVTMIDRIDEYVGLTMVDMKDFEVRIKNEVIPYVEKLEEICSNQQSSESDVNDLLWELIKLWREYFIKFLDIKRSPSQPLQVKEDVKPPVKSKLVDELAKSLEDEISGR